MMLQNFVLALVLPCAATSPARADGPAASAVQKSAGERDFDALEAGYKSALRDYDTARVMADRNGQKLAEPHPAVAWFPRFDALARAGSVGALGWVLQNLPRAIDDPAERARRLRAGLDELIARHPDDEAMTMGLTGLAACVADIGAASMGEILERILRATQHPEVASRAMALQAWLLTDQGRSKDPEKRAAALEIKRGILFAYPQSKAAKEVVSVLFIEAQDVFLQQLKRWIADVRVLQDRGAGPETWPKHPIRELALTLAPLADSGNVLARSMAGSLIPAFEQADRQGPAFSLAWLSKELATYYSSADSEWAGARMGLLSLLLRQFPDANSVPGAIDYLAKHTDALAGGVAEECARLAYERSAVPAVRANALIALAKSLRGVGDQPSYLRAAETFEKFAVEFPDDARAEDARRAARLLRNVLPGARAPEIAAQDVDGLAVNLPGYRGQVMLLVFWDMSEACKATVPEILALERALAGRPFIVIGANVDRLVVKSFREQAAQLGVDWRSAMLYSAAHFAVDEWQVRRWPTRILIDEQGIIRARDLPWAEMTALAETLVRAVESAPRPK